MKKNITLLLLLLLPLLVAAQTTTVPTTVDFAGLRLRLSNGGRRAVQEKVDALLRHPASFQARVDLADAYFPLIDRIFQQQGVPTDFRYLAIQESGLQGSAQSIHDAVGYWQFKREAATDFGLVMNGQVDERKHIIISSQAAAKYLLRSNASLHNWLNVLLSYNLGLGGVRSYTLPTDYDATEMTISEQTHPYVLTFLAHKLAFESAVGLNPQPPLLLQEFPAQAGQSLTTIAFGLQTEADALTRYNPWLAAGAKVPTDRAYTLLVPVTDPVQLTALAAQQKTATTGQLLHQPEADPENAEFVRVNGLRAIVALPGESKEDLARRAGLKLRRFMNFNDLLAFDKVVVGQPYFTQRKRDKAAVEYHAAQPGESVAAVSQKYGVRAHAILTKNRMARNEDLRPGRVLWLQHTRPRNVAVEYATGQNAVALAAFERPVGQTAPAPIATAPAPRPAPAPAAPYGNQTVAPVAVEEESDENNSQMAEADSVANETAENLNELSAAPTPTATPTPTGSLYTGRPATATSPAPASAPTKEPYIEAPASVVLRDPAAPRPATGTTAAGAGSTTGAVEPVPITGLHIVEKSESLYSIGRRYGVRPADLAAWNPALPGDLSLQLGQTLRVTPPTGAAPAPTPPNTTPAPAVPAARAAVQHTVLAGESMYGISRKYGVTINQIMEWNGKPDFNVRPGEVLTIRPAGTR